MSKRHPRDVTVREMKNGKTLRVDYAGNYETA